MTARPNHESVAAALRELPRGPDELTKARMEKRLLAAARAGETRPERGRGPWLAAGIGVVALAAAIALWVRAGEPEAPVARFEVRDVGAAGQRGTLEEGSVLRTGAQEEADIRIADSRVHLAPGTEVRIAHLSPERLSLELTTGEVEVEFHPRNRGEEHLDVTSAHARVEVVGTVFRVRADAAHTEVAVSEGRVRVVPRHGEAPRFVSAGESTEVGEARAAATEVAPAEELRTGEVTEVARTTETEPRPESSESGSSEPVLAENEPTEPESTDNGAVTPESPAPRPPSARALLARARAQQRAHDYPAAAATLEGLLAGRAPAGVRAEALVLLGDLRLRDDPAAAARAYEDAIVAGSGASRSNALFSLARVEERRLGDPGRARETYRRYLQEAPEGALAAQARAALCRLGDTTSCP